MNPQDMEDLCKLLQESAEALDMAALSDANMRGPLYTRCGPVASRCRQCAADVAALIGAAVEPAAPAPGPLFIQSEHLIEKFRRLEIFTFQASGLAMASPSTEGLSNRLVGELVAFRRLIEGKGDE